MFNVIKSYEVVKLCSRVTKKRIITTLLFAVVVPLLLILNIFGTKFTYLSSAFI